MESQVSFQNSEEALFAVYGTLKSKYGNSIILKEGGAELLGTHQTEPIYTMYNGGFPVVERDGKTSVFCEVWKAKNAQTIRRVFSLEGCTGIQHHPNNWYDFDVIETPFGKAVIFVMDKGESGRSNIVESGNWGR